MNSKGDENLDPFIVNVNSFMLRTCMRSTDLENQFMFPQGHISPFLVFLVSQFNRFISTKGKKTEGKQVLDEPQTNYTPSLQLSDS